MIKKIFTNESDLLNLSLNRTIAVTLNIDYKGVVVDKPWGYEYLMFENNQVAVWILFLKHQAKTSIHCHPQKKTSLLVLNGRAKTHSLDSVFDLKAMEGLIIERGVFHSTCSDFENGTFIMEIETPPNKGDLVRLKDEYGRENLGYESGKSISSELEKYEYSHFHVLPAKNKEIKKLIKNKIIEICHSTVFGQLSKKFKEKNKKIICPLNYKLLNGQGKVLLEPGDIMEVKDLQKISRVVVIPKSGLISLFIS